MSPIAICFLCNDEIDRPVTLPCKHRFCFHCLLKTFTNIIKQPETFKCPVCSYKLISIAVIQLSNSCCAYGRFVFKRKDIFLLSKFYTFPNDSLANETDKDCLKIVVKHMRFPDYCHNLCFYLRIWIRVRQTFWVLWECIDNHFILFSQKFLYNGCPYRLPLDFDGRDRKRLGVERKLKSNFLLKYPHCENEFP